MKRGCMRLLKRGSGCTMLQALGFVFRKLGVVKLDGVSLTGFCLISGRGRSR